MSDNSVRTPGTGETIAADEVTDGTLGTVKVQFVKLMDGTLDGTSKAAVGANGLACDVKNASIAGTAGTANAGVLSVQGIASMTALEVAPTLSVAKCIQWSHYSNEYTTTQTSTDLVALSGTTKFYIGRLTIGTGGTTAGLVTIYFGTGAYAAGTSKTVFRGNFAPAATAYPGVVIGNGAAPFIISAAGDALKITTSAGITVYVQVDYVRV